MTFIIVKDASLIDKVYSVIWVRFPSLKLFFKCFRLFWDFDPSTNFHQYNCHFHLDYCVRTYIFSLRKQYLWKMTFQHQFKFFYRKKPEQLTGLMEEVRDMTSISICIHKSLLNEIYTHFHATVNQIIVLKLEGIKIRRKSFILLTPQLTDLTLLLQLYLKLMQSCGLRPLAILFLYEANID